MAIYQGIFGASARFVRADNMAQAVRVMRSAFGFAPRGFITLAGDNAFSIGGAAAYDQAVNKLDGANHPALKRQRIKNRARHAAGKGAAMPAGVEIMTMA